MADYKTQRRNFLKAMLSAAGSVGACGTLAGLGMTKAFAQSPINDYKALVCFNFTGGNDSYNMFIPRDNDTYQQYAQSRQNLAIAKDRLLPAKTANSDSRAYGFHPSMPEVQTLYNQGNLAVIGNVGSLRMPTSLADYKNNRVPVPDSLGSHNDQDDYWQSLQSGQSTVTGWAGRMADAMMDMTNTDSRIPMNISLRGRNVLQTGDFSFPYMMSHTGKMRFQQFNRTSVKVVDQSRVKAFDALMQNTSLDNVFAQEFASVKMRSESLSVLVNDAISSVPAFITPKGSVSTHLETIAKTIAARAKLGMNRQVFFVSMSGFDTHGNQLAVQPNLLRAISQSMGYFYQVTEELGISDQVTTFSTSEFGRTLSSNGDGSDHGWGGHQLVMGGAVKGGNIYGVIPEMVIGGSLDVGRGRLIPTTAIDQYAATLARWFGVPANAIADLFPNLAYFDQIDLGFI